jgi:hypothetical protein
MYNRVKPQGVTQFWRSLLENSRGLQSSSGTGGQDGKTAHPGHTLMDRKFTELAGQQRSPNSTEVAPLENGAA